VIFIFQISEFGQAETTKSLLEAMAGAQKLYPRATVKKIVKAHSKRNVSKNVDVLVGVSFRRVSQEPGLLSLQIFLDYALFLQTYATRFHYGIGYPILVYFA
jgi:hypothetical protein